jgi:hypothetical protein
MSDKIDMIYDLLKTDREESAGFRKEVREAHGDIQERLTKIEILDEVQNKQLEEHIRRTDLLEGLYRANEERITKLEEPKKAISLVKKWVIAAGSVAGAIAAIVSFIKFLG